MDGEISCRHTLRVRSGEPDRAPGAAHKHATTVALAIVLGLLQGCDKPASGIYQGYVEGEFVYLASPYAGQLQKLYVRRGASVAEGQAVFVLNQESEQAAQAEAAERLKSAEAKLLNLKNSRRKPEISAIRAQLAQAQASRNLSGSQLQQQEKLFAGGFVSSERLVEARSVHQRDIARVAEAEAQIRAAQLPLGRNAELASALGDAEAARASLAQAAWRVQQKSIAAPAAGYVQDTFYVEGEWVPAGKPVVALLPPGNRKVRLFVPQSVIGSLTPGQKIEISCDGCGTPIQALITYLSAQAEYTPPIIYSRESRAKLVFLVEARPDPRDAGRLHPGQPVDAKLAPR